MDECTEGRKETDIHPHMQVHVNLWMMSHAPTLCSCYRRLGRRRGGGGGHCLCDPYYLEGGGGILFSFCSIKRSSSGHQAVCTGHSQLFCEGSARIMV